MTISRQIDLEDASAAKTDEWAERCRFWLAEYEAVIPKRKRRERQAHPLILTGNGMSMRVDRGALVIRDGLTHYPQDAKIHRLFPGQLENPPRVVMLDGSGDITLAALDWLAEQNIPLIRLRWDGRVISVVGQTGYAADPDKVAWQIATRKDERARVEFGIPLIRKKLEGTLRNLAEFFPESARRDRATKTAETILSELEQAPPATARELLGLEGKAASAYFAAWPTIPILWKDLEKNPVPEDWLTFKSRSALRAKKVPTNRRATHPVNAMLNYVYGMLEIRTRIQVIADGYDPTKGILHGDGISGRDGYVFDLMEPGRSLAERGIFAALNECQLTACDFPINNRGTCRLGHDLARRMVATNG
ncbi:CRISPR-associated endonuclease Cas1 [Maricaulis sp. CAU 1757]